MKRDILAEAKAISEGMRRLDPEGFDAAQRTVRRNMAEGLASGTIQRCMKAGSITKEVGK